VPFTHYYALGDSMSIDLYPALDLGETAVAVALERNPGAGAIAGVGAAALLHENRGRLWPEFEGWDLASMHPGVVFANLAADGATIGDVFGDQLPELNDSEEAALVTLTVGGSDLLSAFASHRGRRIMASIVRDTRQAYDALVDAVRRTLPNATLLLTTVYDPSDGTGHAPGVFEGDVLPLQHLDTFNGHVREVAARTPNAHLADVHAHFLGRGVTAPEAERWYWRRSPIEPNAAGASEIRRVWLEALEL